MFKSREKVRALERRCSSIESALTRLLKAQERDRMYPAPTAKMGLPIVDCDGKHVKDHQGAKWEHVTLGQAIRALTPEGQELVYCRGSDCVKLQTKREDT